MYTNPKQTLATLLFRLDSLLGQEQNFRMLNDLNHLLTTHAYFTKFKQYDCDISL